MARFTDLNGGNGSSLSVKGLMIMVALGPVGGVAFGGISNPGTHLFESDFIGLSSEVYGSNERRDLVEGWSGQRFGAHGGTSLPYSDVADGVLSFRGGSGNFSDRVNVTHELSTIPSAFSMQIRFRRDGAHISARHDFTMFIGGELYFAGSGGSSGDNQFGVPGSSVLMPLDTGVWYIMEVIDRRALVGPGEINLQGDNFGAPQRSVDWVTMDAAGAGNNLLEMRIWADGDLRPEVAQVLIVPSPGGVGLLGVGGLVAARRRRG